MIQPHPGPLVQKAQTAVDGLRGREDLQPLWHATRQSETSLCDLISAICRIPAPTFDEEVRGDWVAEYLHKHTGETIERDDEGNRWLWMKGARGPGPSVMLSAHLDTVFPAETDLKVYRDNGKLIGPGIGDNCTGLGLLLTAARLLHEHGRPFAGTLLIATNVGEEGLGNLKGMRALCERFGSRLDGSLSLDGGLGNVVGAAVGSLRYRVRVTGPGGHSWSEFGRPNAIHHLAKVAAKLADLRVSDEPRTTFNIGTIQGGTSINTIAPTAELLLDLRSVSVQALAELDAQAREAVWSVPTPEGLAVDLEKIGERPTGDAVWTRNWVDIARATWDALNVRFKVTASSTDANVPLSMNLPASTLGTHRGGGAHTVTEWLDPTSLALGLEGFLLVSLTAQEVLPIRAR